MSVSHKPVQPIDETIARVLRGARANDTAALPKQHTHRTPQCLPVSRVLAVAKSVRGAWTAAEQQHLDGCAFCRGVFAAFNGGQTAPATDDETTTVINFSASDETTHIDPAPRAKPGDGTPPTGK